MGMKLKSGADLCGFQLTNFCVQGEASAPSDAALGRKYFHTNATDDVATGISLLHRERIYLGEGAWRATAYLDDIAAINEKLNLITGDADTDTLINNLKDLEEFLRDFSETDKLKSLLDGKLDKSGGTITGKGASLFTINRTNGNPLIAFQNNGTLLGYLGVNTEGNPAFGTPDGNASILLHSGNYSNYALSLNGGWMVGAATIQWGNNRCGWDDVASGLIGMSILKDDPNYGYYAGLSFKGYYGFQIRNHAGGDTYEVRGHDASTWGTWRTLIHSGNIGSQKVAGLATPVTIWGNSFDGTGNIDGVLYMGGRDVLSKKSNALYIGYQSSTSDSLPTYLWGNGFYFINSGGQTRMFVTNDGNVLIGTTTDVSWAKLNVYGPILTKDYMSFYRNSAEYGYIGLATDGNNDIYINSINELKIAATKGIAITGDTHIKGNLIVDGEISAGGAGAEESTSGSGSAEGVSEIFTPTSTSMAFDHNLGEDVIVQVYEKSGNVWNMVMVDTEITSATRVTLRFGKTETTQHKVVIMGV